MRSGRPALVVAFATWMVGSAAAVLLFPTVLYAQLAVTPGAMARGFTITTYASGFPSQSGVGPISAAYRADGQVIVTDYLGNVRILPSHADDQIVGPAVGVFGFDDAHALAQVQIPGGIRYYMTQRTADGVVRITQNGGLIGAIAAGIPTADGIVPVTAGSRAGHLLVTSNSGINPFRAIYDVDPIAGTAVVLVPNTAADGVAVSPDGATVYVSQAAVIGAFTIPAVGQGVPLFVSPSICMFVDGVALGQGTLDGYIYANCTDGTVWEWGLPGGPHAGAGLTQIAQNGDRGDLIATDPFVLCPGPNGFPSLLLTQTNSIKRLCSGPGGGFFGPSTSSNMPPSAVPTLSAWGVIICTLLVSLSAGTIMITRRRRGRFATNPRL